MPLPTQKFAGFHRDIYADYDRYQAVQPSIEQSSKITDIPKAIQ